MYFFSTSYFLPGTCLAADGDGRLENNFSGFYPFVFTFVIPNSLFTIRYFPSDVSAILLFPVRRGRLTLFSMFFVRRGRQTVLPQMMNCRFNVFFIHFIHLLQLLIRQLVFINCLQVTDHLFRFGSAGNNGAYRIKTQNPF